MNAKSFLQLVQKSYFLFRSLKDTVQILICDHWDLLKQKLLWGGKKTPPIQIQNATTCKTCDLQEIQNFTQKSVPQHRGPFFKVQKNSDLVHSSMFSTVHVCAGTAAHPNDWTTVSMGNTEKKFWYILKTAAAGKTHDAFAPCVFPHP